MRPPLLHPRRGGALVCGVLLLPVAALAQSTPETLLSDAIEQPPAVAQLAGVGAFEEAAEALERAASTLEPRARAVALAHAAQLRSALGDDRGASLDVTRLLSLAHATPEERTRAWVLVERLGARCERAAPPHDGTAVDTPAMFRRREHLRACLELYQEAAHALGDDAPADVRISLRIATARVERGLQNVAVARTLTREAIALYRAAWPDDPAVDVDLDDTDPWVAVREAQRLRAIEQERLRRLARRGINLGGGMAGGAGRSVRPLYFAVDGLTLCNGPREGVGPASTRARACAAVAEGRLSLLLDGLPAFHSAFPRHPHVRTRREYDDWVVAALTPWVTTSLARLRALGEATEAVVNTGSAPQAMAAYAAFGWEWYRFAVRVRQAPPYPTSFPSAWVDREPVATANSDSASQSFVDAAVEAFQRCVRGAVSARAPSSLRGCEEHLHTIDRSRFPLSDELPPVLRSSGWQAAR